MKVQTLSLTNFRGFEKLRLELEPDVTVLVGVNGAGKTSVLDALSKALLQVQLRVLTVDVSVGLDLDDIRVGAGGAAVEATAELDGQLVAWQVAANRPAHAPVGETRLDALDDAVRNARASVRRGEPRLPLGIHLATNRSVLDIPERIRKPHEFDALSAYENALDTGTSDFRGFFEWFREEEDVYNEQRVRQASLPFETRPAPGARPLSLDLVRSAITRLFPKASSLHIERRPQRMMLDVDGTALDVAQLSDGDKCLLAMAGDIARRMVLADTVSVDPLSQEAVVLIDEIELHLHPGAQRTILPRLRQAFPNTQFVVTSHSPQVLSSVRAKNVRLLSGFALAPLERETWRRDTNRILEAVFDDPGRPPEIASMLNKLRDAVDDDRFDEARELIEQLRSELGGDDPDLVFYAQLLPPIVDTAAQ